MNTMHEAVDFMTNITQLHVTTLFSQFEQGAQLYGNKKYVINEHQFTTSICNYASVTINGVVCSHVMITSNGMQLTIKSGSNIK